MRVAFKNVESINYLGRFGRVAVMRVRVVRVMGVRVVGVVGVRENEDICLREVWGGD